MVKKPIETCHLGTVSGKRHFENIMKDEYSYIHEHLETLYFIAKEFKCKNILEIGTGMGHSTAALAQGTEGIVTTIDIDDCHQAKDLIIFACDLGSKVNFIKGDSLKNLPQGFYDLILVDGDHSQERVKKELKELWQNVGDDGFLILHDSTNPKWGKGILDEAINFKNEHYDEITWYQWFNCNGLIIMRKHYID